MADEWGADSFWADLAKPIPAALELFDEADGCALDGPGTDARAKAETGVGYLAELNSTLAKAAASVNTMFVSEHRIVSRTLEAMRSKLEGSTGAGTAAATGGAAAPGGGVAAEAAALGAELEAAQAERKLAEAQLRELKPYSLEQVANKAELTVKIPVPAETKARDVKVKLLPETLSVAVAGHAKQPTVVGGALEHQIDAEASQWHLEGSGDKRTLVLDLEKRQTGLEWAHLVK